jgi:hypothetical protein
MVWRGKKGKVKNLSGVEIGDANATDCLHWAGNKILEHVGFQGMPFGFSLQLALLIFFNFLFFLAATLKVALDVLAAVTSEYLLNVGRTIRFLSDKFGKTMTPEVSKMVSYAWYNLDINALLGNHLTHPVREWFFENPRSGTIYI